MLIELVPPCRGLNVIGRNNPEIKYQFKDRLFDRDTMLLSRYNVNFLFVISLYARNRQAEKAAWKDEVRKQFREQIRCVLGRHYRFYPMRSRGVDLNEYMTAHFRDLIGKVFTPFEDKNIVSLALEKTQDPQIAANQARLLDMLDQDFYIDRNYTLGNEPELPQPIAMRFGLQDTVIIGYYRSEEQLNWIRENKLYNVRVEMPKARSKYHRHWSVPSICYFMEHRDNSSIAWQKPTRHCGAKKT